MSRSQSRNPYVLPMTLRHHKQIFHDRRERRGGNKKDLTAELLEESKDLDVTDSVDYDDIQDRSEEKKS